MGEWDVQAIRYGYTEFAPGADERAGLDAIVKEGLAHGLIFLTDEDARPEGSANPLAHLWDNGPDAAEGLRHELAVRRIGLANFGEHNIAPGQPLALLQEVLVPLYFHHRYQLEARLQGGRRAASTPMPCAATASPPRSRWTARRSGGRWRRSWTS